MSVLTPFPTQPQVFQNPAKPGQARAKKIKEKWLGFLGFPSAESSLFNELS
jgi:hypothetical protein